MCICVIVKYDTCVHASSCCLGCRGPRLGVKGEHVLSLKCITTDWLTEVFMPHAWIDPAVYDGLLVPVTNEEMKSTLDKQGGTAPGPSGVTRKLPRNGGEASVDMLRVAYNLILASGEWPRDMLLGLIFPICKKEGPCVLINARPITLTETATKGLTGILAQRLKRVLTTHPWIEHSQLAFLP